jgi:hypothetical protein
MKASVKTLLAVGSLVGIACLSSAPAMAQPSGFSFRVGDVAFGYSDGYYDHNRQWHAWRGRERDWYRNHYRTNYRSMRHDRDHDGIADRFDRDRDNDGVRNSRDRSPNNPNRH